MAHASAVQCLTLLIGILSVSSVAAHGPFRGLQDSGEKEEEVTETQEQRNKEIRAAIAGFSIAGVCALLGITTVILRRVAKRRMRSGVCPCLCSPSPCVYKHWNSHLCTDPRPRAAP